MFTCNSVYLLADHQGQFLLSSKSRLTKKKAFLKSPLSDSKGITSELFLLKNVED